MLKSSVQRVQAEEIICFHEFVTTAAEQLLDALGDEHATDSDIRACAQGLDSSVRALSRASHITQAELWLTVAEVLSI